MRNFWIIFAVVATIGIIAIWIYIQKNKNKEVVYKQVDNNSQKVGAKDYIDSVTTGVNALSGLFGTLKKPAATQQIASSGGSGAIKV